MTEIVRVDQVGGQRNVYITATAEKYPELIGEGPIRGYDVTNFHCCEFCARPMANDERIWVWYMDSLYWYLVPVHRGCHRPEREDPSMQAIARVTYGDPTDDDLTFEWSDGLDIGE